MNNATKAILAILIVGFIGFAGYSLMKKQENAIDYKKYDFNTVIEGNEDNGGISDHIKGNPNAPVKIFEYADYQCPACSSVYPWISELVNEYNGKLAIVYRSFLLPYHQNGTAAASAAEAAGLQGYWEEYATILFENQSEWENASLSDRSTYFNTYFANIVGSGITEEQIKKFNDDISSDAVSKKISFDMGIAKRMNLPGTPAFYLDGEMINWSKAGGTKEAVMQLFRDEINKKLATLEQK